MKTSQPLVDETVASMLLRYPDHEVHPFQREILDTWLRPDVRVAGWSAARGAAKTAWAARAVAEYLSGPLAGDGGEEIAVVASSHAQASILMRDVSTRYLARDLARHGVGGQGRSRGRYRVIDNSNNLLIEDHQTRMRARVVGSDSRRAHGLRCRVIIADEPAQWGPRGELLWSSLVTGLGKVEGSRLLSIGTRPADDSHFFARFLDHARPDEGTVAVVHAADRDADPFGWESVQAANPGLPYGLPSARLLRQELAAARRDPAALQTWRALRLNQGVTDVVLDGDLLCPAEEFAAALTNDVPDPAGPAAWGVDLGGSRSMSAVAAYWPRSGLVKVRAALPTVPDLDIRGRQDGARDVYRRAVASGELVTSGERLCDVTGLLAGCARDWGPPMVVVADRHRYAEVLEVLDRFPPVEVVWRHRRVTDGAADVAIFRSALDGRRLKVSRRQELLAWSISQGRTKRNIAGQGLFALRARFPPRRSRCRSPPRCRGGRATADRSVETGGGRYRDSDPVSRRAVSRYGPGWKRFAARLVLERAECEKCHSVTRLQVHHRVPLEAGGDIYPADPDCRQTGLAVLCLTCHIGAHSDRLSQGRRAWLDLRQQLQRDNET